MTDNKENIPVKNSIEVANQPGLEVAASSNPATPTYFSSNSDKKRTFLNIVLPVTNISDSKRKPLINKAGHPYHPARLVQHQGKYVIQFYVWDITQKKLKRRRVLKHELAARVTRLQMMDYAQTAIDEINQALKHGGYQQSIAKKEKVNSISFRAYSLLQAIDHAIDIKKNIDRIKHGSIREYNLFKDSIISYMDHAGLNKAMKLASVDEHFVNGYLHYLVEVKKLSNKSHNNRLGIFKTIVNLLIRYDPLLFIKGNPLRFARNLKPGIVRKHAAFTDAQMLEIKNDLLQDGKTYVWIYIQFIYFTLARPNELRHLKVGQINIERRQILIGGDHSKTGIEAYVGISDSFAQVIMDSGILQFDADLFVFSNLHDRPGPVPAGMNYYYKQIRPYLKKFRQINPNYDTYGFKHSGAISLFIATRDPYLVQRQCRHTTLSQTQKYLRDLGVFIGMDKLKDWKGI